MRDHDGFKVCMNNARKPKRADKEVDSNDVTTITWGDILQSWELEAKGKVKLEIHMDFNAEDFLGTEEVIVIANGGVKHKRGLSSICSLKKITTDHSPSPVDPIAPKEVHCAFYGIRRLQYSMDITHSISVLVSGEELSHFFFTFFLY